MRALLLSMMLCRYVSVSAQQDLLVDDFNGKAYFGLSVVGALFSKTKITPATGLYKISSNPQIGYEILLHYNLTVEKNISLSLGAGAILAGYNFNYDIAKDMFDPPTQGDISSNKAASRSTDLLSFKVQGDVQYRLKMTGLNSIQIGTGLSLLFALPNDETINEFVFYPTGSTRNFLQRRQNTSYKGKPWPNIHVFAAYDLFATRRRIIGVFAKFNYSPVRFLKGEYDVDPGQTPPAFGEYYFTGTYLGIGFQIYFVKR